MKRFNFDGNNDDYSNKWEEHDDDDDEEFDWEETFELDGDAFLSLELKQAELDQKLLEITIKFLSKSIFWKFRKITTKLKMISETYEYFRKLTEGDIEVDENGINELK